MANRRVLTDLVNHLIANGVHGLTPLGSTGEFAYLNWDQKIGIVATVVEVAAGRVPVMAGVVTTTTAENVRQAKALPAMGVNGLLAVLEAYFPISDASIITYLRTISEAVDCSVVLYTNPQFQRSDLSLSVIANSRKFRTSVT